MSSQLIHCHIVTKGFGVGFFGTFVYGFNFPKDREPLWDSLKSIASMCNDPWIVMGDFNAVMELEHRIGSTVRLTETQPMSNCMSLCNLSVIKTVGRHFTWNNKQEGADRVFSMIDRVLSNAKCSDLFETAEAAYLDEATFDHCPMILRCYKAGCVKKPFRFFNMWVNANSFMELVESTWGKYVYGCHMFRIVQKLKWLKPALKTLNGQGFSNLETEKVRLHHKLLQAQQALHMDPNNANLATTEKQAASSYASAHKNYLSYLQQTAKLHWLKVGDENTRAFHQSIKHRRKRNKINSIQTENDTGTRLTDAHKESLKCNFTHSDIKRVLDTIPNDKAPGMDGYNSLFFKTAWPVVKDDMTRAINDFFSTGKMLKEINVTSITLVPKGAFVAGRSILHNVLVCQDIVKIYGKSHKQLGCLMKLDLRKAYDTVAWDFIKEMMTGLGFPVHFIDLIMTCLSTTQYSLMINGAPSKLIQPKRGLRQGDPLSPLLFTLCMEYFSRGTPEVVQLMLDGFHCFCNTTGLQVNPKKSSIFCCGMNSQLQNHIAKLSGFNVGSIPFTYLGVPISAKKLRGVECDLLIDKMVARIKIWSSRHISFAGRMQLVNSVLMILKKINAIYRFYLWFGSYADNRPGAVALDKLCCTKSEWGLGFRNLVLWNQAAIGKQAWAISKKEDNMWFKWVHDMYVKDKNWDPYTAPITASWAVKIVCKVKNMFNGKLQSPDWLTVNKYSIKGMYQNLSEVQPKTHWAKQRKQLHTCTLGVLIVLVARLWCFSGLIYHLWRARNYVVWDAMVPTVLQTVKRVQLDTKGRIQQLIGKKVKSYDLDWFSAL
ncbi:uncharacterized protein [Spinacia oleracea]|uniref:Reverse transcriptase domain-containing protein n=1 Tax=Spinacia oleracea TaxID=3562 RepID=A0A9R0ITF1_SPIOL|nr:uncharacterized protein LOC110793376 [Spinacia oleracea]